MRMGKVGDLLPVESPEGGTKVAHVGDAHVDTSPSPIDDEEIQKHKDKDMCWL